MKNKKGIILDNPLERYIEIDSNYYKNYDFIFKYDENKRKQYFNTLKQNYKFEHNDLDLLEFGDIVEVYSKNIKAIYLYSHDRFCYLCTNKNDSTLNIFKVNCKDIKITCEALNDFEKDLTMFSLESMLKQGIGIPKKTESSLSKLLIKKR